MNGRRNPRVSGVLTVISGRGARCSSAALRSCWRIHSQSFPSIVWRMRPSDGLLSAPPCWRGDNWIISPGNQLGPRASNGTRVKQRLAESWRGGGGRGRMTGLIDYLRRPGTSTPRIPPFLTRLFSLHPTASFYR